MRWLASGSRSIENNGRIWSQIRWSGHAGDILDLFLCEGPVGQTDRSKLSVGLCASCRFMRVMKSDRGSSFYMCQLSATDPAFPKYPRLPVLECLGYQKEGKDTTTRTTSRKSGEKWEN